MSALFISKFTARNFLWVQATMAYNVQILSKNYVELLKQWEANSNMYMNLSPRYQKDIHPKKCPFFPNQILESIDQSISQLINYMLLIDYTIVNNGCIAQLVKTPIYQLSTHYLFRMKQGLTIFGQKFDISNMVQKYSHLSNKRGGWNKREWGALVVNQ